jgi:hypothetical protein
LIIIDAENVFVEGSIEDTWGYRDFVRYDKLYSVNNRFVKNDVVFLCAHVIREDALSKPKIETKTEFHRNLWSSYKKGLTGECTLNVSGKEFKVKITLFRILYFILGFEDAFDGSFEGL